MDSTPKVWKKMGPSGRLERSQSPSEEGPSKSPSEEGASKSRKIVEEVTEKALQYEQPDSRLYSVAVNLAKECPQLQEFAEKQPTVVINAIKEASPGISGLDAIKVASYFISKQDGSSAQRKWRFSASSSNEQLQYNSSHSYQDKGAHAKRSYFDPTLPRCTDQVTPCWTQEGWDEILSMGTSLESTMEALTKAVNLTGCFFELVVTAGTIQTIATHKPDVILKLKGFPLRSVEALVAIINLQSSTTGCYDSDEDVGKMIAIGQKFLAQSSPQRKSVVVGVSNLKMIKFFWVARASIEESLVLTSLGGFAVSRDEPTSNLREILSAYLRAHPATLDVHVSLNWKSLLPPSWKLVNHLGHGRTSIVYLVCEDEEKYAVKVAREGFMLDNELKFLRQLADVEGVPKVHTVLNSSSVLVMQPVGEPFTRRIMEQYGSLL